MPRDPEERAESGRKGGQASRTHGVHAIQARGEAAMTADQRLALAEVEEQIRTPEGILEALAGRVAQGIVILRVLEQHVAAEVAAGKSLDTIQVLRWWAGFPNSAIRALMHLRATMPKQAPDSYQGALERINRVIDEHMERQAAQDASGGPQAALDD